MPLASAQAVYYLRSYGVLLALGILGATPLVYKAAMRCREWPASAALIPAVALALLLVCTAYLVDGSFNPFLYIRF